MPSRRIEEPSLPHASRGSERSPTLDNWVWHALAGSQAPVAERHGRAARYPLDVSPFAAVDDEAGPGAWRDLAELVGPGQPVVLFRAGVEVPPGWEVRGRRAAVQMVLPSADQLTPRAARPPAGDTDDAGDAHAPIGGLAVRRLGDSDADAMLDLVARTQPGPFERRTVQLGTYVGVHDGDKLVAMAGERTRPPGWTEISAVCTDPAYRGRGMAAELVRRVSLGIFARGDRPFLHAAAGNDAAIAVYERLGFAHRRGATVLLLTSPRSTPG